MSEVRVLQRSSAKDYEFLVPRGTSTISALHAFVWTGAPTNKDVARLRYKLLRTCRQELPTDDDVPLVPSDAPWATCGLLVLRTAARDGLAEVLASSGRFIDLPGHEGELHAFYSTVCLDIVDWQRSIVDRIPSGAVILPRRIVLREPPPSRLAAFRLRNLIDLFVTEAFVEAWRRGGWEGLEFADLDAIWASSREAAD